MNWYELEIYFKNVCNLFYVAYDKVERLRTKEVDSFEKDFWEKALEEDKKQIIRIVIACERNKNPLIITTKEEVFSLLYFFQNHSLDATDVISQDAICLMSFPQDELSRKFLKAYQKKDNWAMHELMEEFRNEIK